MSKRIGLNYLTPQKKAQHLGRMYVSPTSAVLHYSVKDEPLKVEYFPNREHLTTLPYYRLQKQRYDEDTSIELEFNFKTSYFHGTYGLPRYYREKLVKMLPDYQRDFVHYVNTWNYERNYYKKYADFMQEHGFTHWSPECDKQWNEYQRNVKTIKTDKMRNKYYTPDNFNLYG